MVAVFGIVFASGIYWATTKSYFSNRCADKPVKSIEGTVVREQYDPGILYLLLESENKTKMSIDVLIKNKREGLEAWNGIESLVHKGSLVKANAYECSLGDYVAYDKDVKLQ